MKTEPSIDTPGAAASSGASRLRLWKLPFGVPAAVGTLVVGGATALLLGYTGTTGSHDSSPGGTSGTDQELRTDGSQPLAAPLAGPEGSPEASMTPEAEVPGDENASPVAGQSEPNASGQAAKSGTQTGDSLPGQPGMPVLDSVQASIPAQGGPGFTPGGSVLPSGGAGSVSGGGSAGGGGGAAPSGGVGTPGGGTSFLAGGAAKGSDEQGSQTGDSQQNSPKGGPQSSLPNNLRPSSTGGPNDGPPNDGPPNQGPPNQGPSNHESANHESADDDKNGDKNGDDGKNGEGDDADNGSGHTFAPPSDRDPISVPEPGTLFLVGSGAAGLLLRQIRRRKTKTKADAPADLS